MYTLEGSHTQWGHTQSILCFDLCMLHVLKMEKYMSCSSSIDAVSMFGVVSRTKWLSALNAYVYMYNHD